MLIVFRWWYWAGMAGVALFAHGAIESTLALKAGSEPIAVSVEDLASGKPLAQRWVTVGRHVALEPLGTSWRGKRGKGSKVLYPLAEPDDPIVGALAPGKGKLKSDLPGFDTCHVFALRGGTTLAKTACDVEASEGVVFEFDELSTNEQSLVTLAIPKVDRTKVRVVELGRRPEPLAFAVGTLVAGNVLLYVAIRLFRAKRAQKAAKAGKTEAAAEPNASRS